MSSGSQKNDFVADTMALVLRLEKRKMSKDSKAAFDRMEEGNCTISLPTMIFAEILYLSEKKRIVLTLPEIETYLTKNPGCKECPMSLAIVAKAGEIKDVQELHDRLIGATASLLGLPLITNDPILRASSHLQTIW